MGFVIGAGDLRWVVMWWSYCAFFPLLFALSTRCGYLRVAWASPFWPLGLGGVGRRLYSVRITKNFCSGAADD